MWYSLTAVALLLAASACTSGTETAMTGASRARMHQLANEGERRAAKFLRNRRKVSATLEVVATTDHGGRDCTAISDVSIGGTPA